MEKINAELLSRLKALDDESLRRLIAGIAQAAGVDERSTERALANVKHIRNRVSRMNSDELQRTVDSFERSGESEQINAVYDELKKRLL